VTCKYSTVLCFYQGQHKVTYTGLATHLKSFGLFLNNIKNKQSNLVNMIDAYVLALSYRPRSNRITNITKSKTFVTLYKPLTPAITANISTIIAASNASLDILFLS